MRLLYDTAAREEGFAAAEWYGQQQGGLQIRFLEKWKDAENRMIGSPHIHRCFEGELRKCRFDVFPYALVFRIQGEDLQVIAVMHMRRRPAIGKRETDSSPDSNWLDLNPRAANHLLTSQTFHNCNTRR